MTDKLTRPQSNEPQKLAYRIDEAVKASGLGRSFLYEQIASGALQSVKIGNCRLIMHDELVRFLTGAGRAIPSIGGTSSGGKTEPTRKSKCRENANPPGQLELLLKR